MPSPSTDEAFSRRALDLARQGLGLVSPSPYVGAVIVDARQTIVGEGVYIYDGKTHAEILALNQAGDKARGGTLYINLEPHAHQGRTTPCTDALIAAGIRRVVASMADPNPKVSGRGFEQLRSSGVDVEVGLLEAEARRLNEAFARYIRHGTPLVTLKSAMSLDARIAPSQATKKESGIPAGGWITGNAARAHVQRQRHESDAILVGIGTVLADDPLLTDRSGSSRRRPLLRVILDSHLRLPMDSRIVQSAAQGAGKTDVLVFCSSLDEKKKRELESRGVRVENVAAKPDGRQDFQTILRRLGELEITSVIIEGGSTINSAALASGIVDKVFLYYAPTILGGCSVSFAIPFEARPGMTIKEVRLHRFEEDIAVEGYLRDPYAGLS